MRRAPTPRGTLQRNRESLRHSAMDEQRRYRDDEIEAIFQRAASPAVGRGASAASREGLTLAELQAIGREVGLPPEKVAEAAAALDLRSDAPRLRSLLGMPGAVDRTVPMPRLPTDREWELLLVDLRTTFAARGSDRSQGALREWTNGNLFALVEPTETGARLRLGTVKGSAIAINWLGIAALLVGLITLLNLVVTDDLASVNALLPVLWGALGLSAFGYNAVRLRRWAHTRELQMASIGQRALELTSGAPRHGAEGGAAAGGAAAGDPSGAGPPPPGDPPSP